jgi:hypothetical protein
MAVRRQPLAVLQDENAEINRGKSTVTKSVGLKTQQPDLSDRITLANITNKPKPRNSGLVSPIAPRKAENHTKGGFGGSFSSAKIGRAGILPRTALGDITNGVESCKAPDTAVKRKKVQGKNVKMGPNPRYELAEEEKQKADAWAREGIERVQFSGKDMEALKEKIAKEEVNSRVAQALSYRTEIPCFLPRALQKDSSIITDFLELDPVEDLCKKGDSPCDDMKLEDVDYDDSFLECLEILQNASKNWPGIMEDCVY